MEVKIVEKQIYIDAAGERFVQVGTSHLRHPFSGKLLGNPEPIYIKESCAAERSPTADKLLSDGEKNLLGNIAEIFAAKHREYMHGVKRIDAVNQVKAPDSRTR